MGEARHITLEAVVLTVTAAFEATGSILADTAQHRLRTIETALEIHSPAPPEQIATLVATAERMCFVLDAIQREHDVRRTVTLNGEPLT